MADGRYGKPSFLKYTMMNKINYMDSVTGSNTRTVEIQKIFKAIKQGVWKTQISEIRNHISNGEDDKAGAVKGRLPAFTVSATFKGSRNKRIQMYPQVFCTWIMISLMMLKHLKLG